MSNEHEKRAAVIVEQWATTYALALLSDDEYSAYGEGEALATLKLNAINEYYQDPELVPEEEKKRVYDEVGQEVAGYLKALEKYDQYVTEYHERYNPLRKKKEDKGDIH